MEVLRYTFNTLTTHCERRIASIRALCINTNKLFWMNPTKKCVQIKQGEMLVKGKQWGAHCESNWNVTLSCRWTEELDFILYWRWILIQDVAINQQHEMQVQSEHKMQRMHDTDNWNLQTRDIPRSVHQRTQISLVFNNDFNTLNNR